MRIKTCTGFSPVAHGGEGGVGGSGGSGAGVGFGGGVGGAGLLHLPLTHTHFSCLAAMQVACVLNDEQGGGGGAGG